MGHTKLTVKDRDFYINDKLVYAEQNASKDMHGLLMNARFIQGIFDDKSNPRRFDRFGKVFDPMRHTEEFIAALPEWYNYGLRAVTVGLQGGMPVFTIDVKSIDHNPFGADGLDFDEGYKERLDKIIVAADKIGMVVIVNMLYWAQSLRFQDEEALISALKKAAKFLKEKAYTNVIIDVANEYNIETWEPLPIVKNPANMKKLIELVREESGGMLVGSSGGGGLIDPEVVDVSDVVLVHGNGLSRGEYYDFLLRVKGMTDKPILCNEDSPCISRLEIAKLTHTSWGYYNNFTKQEPPCDWSVTKGQDYYFARRMAKVLGLEMKEIPFEERFYIQGLEKDTSWQGKRWIQLASEVPEMIDYVDFYRNGNFLYRSYDEPFFLYRETTWIQKPWMEASDDYEWKVVITLTDGRSVVKEAKKSG